MSLMLPGLDLVKNEVEEIRSGRLRYAMIDLSTTGPISLSIIKRGGESGEFDYKKKYCIEELKDVFEEFSGLIRENEAGLVIYDFIYFDNDDIQKNTLCLISYIPEQLGTLKKVAYSTNALNIKNLLDIPLHISTNKKSDINFDNIAAKCAASRMK